MSQNQKNGSDNPLGKNTNESGPESDGNELNELVALKVFLNIFLK
jgi:hypothetical protein